MSPKSQVLFQYLYAKQVKQIRYKILDIVRCQSKVCCKYYFGAREKLDRRAEPLGK